MRHVSLYIILPIFLVSACSYSDISTQNNVNVSSVGNMPSQENVTDKDVRAFARTKGEINEAVLEVNGEEEIMKSADKTDIEKGVFGLDFEQFIISPSNRYVIFSGKGWEWHTVFLYDTVQKEILLEILNTSIHLLPSEEDAYVCAMDYYGGAMFGKIFTIPAAKEKYSLFNDPLVLQKVNPDFASISDVTCNYDSSSKTVHFSIVTEQDMRGEPVKKIDVFVDPKTGENVRMDI